jgi:hypothetical protein
MYVSLSLCAHVCACVWSYLVVGARHGQHRLVRRVPLDRGNGVRVPPERRRSPAPDDCVHGPHPLQCSSSARKERDRWSCVCRWAYAVKWRRSQIEKVPSSAPEASKCEVVRFHERTLTSAACASTDSAGAPRLRVSHTLIVRSTEHDANTSFSTGLHPCPPPAQPPPCHAPSAASPPTSTALCFHPCTPPLEVLDGRRVSLVRLADRPRAAGVVEVPQMDGARTVPSQKPRAAAAAAANPRARAHVCPWSASPRSAWRPRTHRPVTVGDQSSAKPSVLWPPKVKSGAVYVENGPAVPAHPHPLPALSLG